MSDFSDTHENNTGSFTTEQIILVGNESGHHAPAQWPTSASTTEPSAMKK